MGTVTYPMKNLGTPGKQPPFDFNNQTAVKSSVSVKKTGQSAEGGEVNLTNEWIGENTEEDNTTTVAGCFYNLSLILSKTFQPIGYPSYTIFIPSTIDILFSWLPYIAPPNPPEQISGDNTKPLPMATAEEWASYREAWGGFNIPFVDKYHRDTLGNGLRRAKQKFSNVHIKDAAQAEDIAKKLMFDSQYNYTVDFPAIPYFNLKLGEFVNIQEDYNNINSIERIEKRSWKMKTQDFIVSMRARRTGA